MPKRQIPDDKRQQTKGKNMENKSNPYGYSGDYDQYRTGSEEGHKTENSESEIINNQTPPVPDERWEKATEPQGAAQTVPTPPAPEINATGQNPADYASYPVAPGLNNPYNQQYAGQHPAYAGQGYPQGYAPVVTPVDPLAQKLAYWGIGLFGGNVLLVFLLGAFVIPFFLIPITSIAGIIVSRKSNAIQKNQLATVSFWLHLVSLILTAGIILLLLFVLALVTTAIS